MCISWDVDLQPPKSLLPLAMWEERFSARGCALIGLLQRVVEARVDIDGNRVAAIDAGLLVLVGIHPTDDEATVSRLLDRLLHYRVFEDEDGKMNLSLTQTKGDLLLVPQFTLAAETRKGLRPGFSSAAPPDQGRSLFDFLVQAARARHARVETGVFGAHMRVSLTNDGPVTFWLES
jgi:D-aminoacyl-tRNA deacylase